MDECLEKLEKRSIKPTAMRLLILKTMMQLRQAVSLSDLEAKLDTVDKSTIFRAITLFLSHRLVHRVDDGTGSLKYAVCGNECMCAIEDLHTHFYCRNCHKTFCLEHMHIPNVELPKGFMLQSVNFVLKGICSNCTQPENTGVSE